MAKQSTHFVTLTGTGHSRVVQVARVQNKPKPKAAPSRKAVATCTGTSPCANCRAAAAERAAQRQAGPRKPVASWVRGILDEPEGSMDVLDRWLDGPDR
jgi:hypothetical protein